MSALHVIGLIVGLVLLSAGFIALVGAIAEHKARPNLQLFAVSYSSWERIPADKLDAKAEPDMWEVWEVSPRGVRIGFHGSFVSRHEAEGFMARGGK
jgi:hypothetical protein